MDLRPQSKHSVHSPVTEAGLGASEIEECSNWQAQFVYNLGWRSRSTHGNSLPLGEYVGTDNMAFLRNMHADKLSSLIPSMLSASWNKTNELMQKTVHITLTMELCKGEQKWEHVFSAVPSQYIAAYSYKVVTSSSFRNNRKAHWYCCPCDRRLHDNKMVWLCWVLWCHSDVVLKFKRSNATRLMLLWGNNTVWLTVVPLYVTSIFEATAIGLWGNVGTRLES